MQRTSNKSEVQLDRIKSTRLERDHLSSSLNDVSQRMQGGEKEVHKVKIAKIELVETVEMQDAESKTIKAGKESLVKLDVDREPNRRKQ